MSRLLCALCLWLGLLPAVAAQDFEFRVPPNPDDAALATAMSDLALRILPVYEEKDSERYLANLSALQLASGNADPAVQTRRFLRERREASGRHLRVPRVLFHDVQMRARAAPNYVQGYAQAFREAVGELSDREAHAFGRLCSGSPIDARALLLAALDRRRGRERIALNDAFELLWTYLAYEGYRRSTALVPALVGEDQSRRYLTEDLRLSTREGVEVGVRVVRPRGRSTPRASLLEFGIATANPAASAAHGFVGVAAIATRGEGPLMPFRFDAQDAGAVIDWIVQQPWSDGRVGMLGEGYSGFAAWSVAQHRPAALKAIATIDAMAPGVDFPAEGRVLRNAAYEWALGLSPNPAARDAPRGAALDRAWYESGRPYRELERIARQPSEIFRNWIAHPSYDRWWQMMIPFRAQFAQIDLPVLTMLSGAVPGSGALYYFDAHRQHAAQADHRLLLAARESARVDPAALLDLRELRLNWFEHVLQVAPPPALLRDRINLRVAGAREWRHLPALPDGAWRLHLRAEQLAPEPDREASAELEADLSRRAPPGSPMLRFTSEPLPRATELVGILEGELDLWLDAQDVDLRVAAWEQPALGERIALFEPYVFRASYAHDRTQRQLLRAGVRQTLPFRVERLLARRLAPGSRIVVELGVNRELGVQLNVGSGREVSTESRTNTRRSLKMRVHGGSFVALPVSAQELE